MHMFTFDLWSLNQFIDWGCDTPYNWVDNNQLIIRLLTSTNPENCQTKDKNIKYKEWKTIENSNTPGYTNQN